MIGRPTELILDASDSNQRLPGVLVPGEKNTVDRSDRQGCCPRPRAGWRITREVARMTAVEPLVSAGGFGFPVVATLSHGDSDAFKWASRASSPGVEQCLSQVFSFREHFHGENLRKDVPERLSQKQID